MAPDDVKLERRLARLCAEGQPGEQLDGGQSEAAAKQATEGPNDHLQQQQQQQHQNPSSQQDRRLGEQVRKSTNTEELPPAMATREELARTLAANSGPKINKYGACDQQQQQRDAGQKQSLGELDCTSSANANMMTVNSQNLLFAANQEKPRTLSAYFMGKQMSWLPGRKASESQRKESPTGGEEARESGRAGSARKPKRTRLERVAKCVPGLGIIMSLCASLLLGTAGMLVKLTKSVHGIEVAVLRATIQLVIYSSIIGCRGIGWMPPRNEALAVATRALLGGLSITLSYCALKLIPLGDATTIRFSLPIWTLIMSYFFLRESCTSFKIFAVIISVSGVVLVTKPDMCVLGFHKLLHLLAMESSAELALHEREYEHFRGEELALLFEAPPDRPPLGSHPLVSSSGANQTGGANSTTTSLVGQAGLTYSPDAVRQFEGCMMALGSSICLSISIIALRLSKRTSSEISILWLSIFSIVIGSLTLLAMGEWSVPGSLRDFSYILLNGVCGSLGQWFMTNALKVEQSGVIALARTFDIEVAFLYSAFLLGEEIRLTSIFGSVLVSLGVISVVVPKWLGCGPEAAQDEEEQQGEEQRTEETTDCSSEHSASGECERPTGGGGGPLSAVGINHAASDEFERAHPPGGARASQK